MQHECAVTAARLGEGAHAALGAGSRAARRERRRIEVARDTLEGGTLAHQRLLLTRRPAAGRRTAGRGGPISRWWKSSPCGTAAGGGSGGRGGRRFPRRSGIQEPRWLRTRASCARARIRLVPTREKPRTTMAANACVACAMGAIPHGTHRTHRHLVIVGGSSHCPCRSKDLSSASGLSRRPR